MDTNEIVAAARNLLANVDAGHIVLRWWDRDPHAPGAYATLDRLREALGAYARERRRLASKRGR